MPPNTTPITQAAREAAEKVMGHCAHKAVRLPNKYAVEEIVQTAIDQAREADQKRIEQLESVIGQALAHCTIDGPVFAVDGLAGALKEKPQ